MTTPPRTTAARRPFSTVVDRRHSSRTPSSANALTAKPNATTPQRSANGKALGDDVYVTAKAKPKTSPHSVYFSYMALRRRVTERS